jgi:tRNA (guanine-N7-)-methyltransferase
VTADGRDIPGAFGGSRLFDQPAWRAEAAAWAAFVAPEARPLLIEVGFDHGRRLTATAGAWPGWRVAGLEVRQRRVAEAQAFAATHALHNLHAWRADARTALGLHTPDASVQVVEVLFPVPWETPSRARRLLIEPGFLGQVARVLAPGGALHLATDVAWYATQMAEAAAAVPALQHDPSAATLRPPIEALSRREWKHTREGTPIHRLWYRRTGAP